MVRVIALSAVGCHRCVGDHSIFFLLTTLPSCPCETNGVIEGDTLKRRSFAFPMRE